MRCTVACCSLVLALVGCHGTSSHVVAPRDGDCAPEVQASGANVVHVTAPRQRVTVSLPGAESPAPAAAAYASACAPPPPALAPAPPMMAPAPAPQPAPSYGFGGTPMNVTTTQSMSPPHPRLALGFETIRIPIPFPRFFAVPGEQEIVTRQTQLVAPSPPLAFAPPAYVPAAGPPVYAAAPVYAPMPAPAPTPYAVQVTTQHPAPAASAPVSLCPPTTGSGESVEDLKRRLEMLQRLMQERGMPCPPQQ